MADVGVRVTVSGAEDGQRKLDDFSKSIGKIEDGGIDATDAMKLFAGVAAGALATAAVYAGQKLYSAFEETRRLGDEMNNLSQRTGIAVEKLSGGLRLAAETTGSSVEGLATGMNQLNRAISEAADGTGKQAEAFKRLGIDVHDSTGKLKSADQVLNEIATAFAGAEDGAVKTEIAMTLLGRSGAVLIPLLNQGADGLSKLEREAKLAGITLDKETAEAASKLNENLRILSAHGQGFWVQIASPMIGGLAKITGAIRQARLESEGWLAAMGAGIGKALNMMGLSTPGMSEEDQRNIAITQIQNRQQLLAAQRAQPGGGDPGMIRSLTEQIRRFEEERDRLNAVLAINNPTYLYSEDGAPRGKTELAPPTPKAGGVGGQERNTAYQEEMQRINALKGFEIQAIHETEKEQERAYREEMQRIGAVKSNDLLSINEIQAAEKKALDESQKAKDRAAQSEIRQINETTYLFKEDKIAALEEVERKYLDMGEAGAKGLQRVRGDMEALKGTTKATGVIVQDVGFDMGKVWQGVHTGLTQAIGDIARYALGIGDNIKSLGDALKGFFLSITNSIIDMFAKIAANKIFEWLFGGKSGDGLFGGLLGELGNAIGGIVGGDEGGVGGGLLNAVTTFTSKAFGGSGSLLTDIGNLLGIEGAGTGAGVGTFAPAGMFTPEAGVALTEAFGGSAALVDAPWGVNAISGAGAGSAALGAGAVGAIYLAMQYLNPDKPDPMDPVVRATIDSYLTGSNKGALSGPIPDDVKAQLRKWFGTDIHRDTDAEVGWSAFDLSQAFAYRDLHNAGYVDALHGTRYATGTDMIVSKPTFFSAGEVGTERVTVSPIGASHRGGGGGISVSVNGFSMIDAYGARRLAYELKRVLAS